MTLCPFGIAICLSTSLVRSSACFLGYSASRLLARQEARERRIVLIDALRDQLASLPDPSQVGSANTRRVISFSALGHLLSGEVKTHHRVIHVMLHRASPR